MTYTYTFEKLEVWQLSRSFVKDIYEVTKLFPKDEQYGLTSQIRRAAVSISSNIAEGSSRLTTKDRAHFTMIAFSSAIEVVNQIIIACDLEYITLDILTDLKEKLAKLTNKLNAYHKAQLQQK